MKALKIILSLAVTSTLIIVWFVSTNFSPISANPEIVSENDSVKISVVAPEVSPEQAGMNVLPQIIALNWPNNPAPSGKFRNGHVTKAEISDYLLKQSNGFEIKLPNQTNVPTPCIYNGICYVSGGFGSKQYYAFNAKTGEKIWAINLDDDGPSCAAIVDGVIVFNTESCTIFACDANTGESLWSYWLGDPLMSMPTIANGMVFTAYPAYSQASGIQQQNSSFNNNINNLNVQNNQYQTDEAMKQPADTGTQKDSTISIRATHALVAFDLKSGKVLWQKWIDGDVMSAPVAKDDELYVTSFSGTLYKFDQKTGDILSARATRATSAPIIDGDQVYFSKRSDTKGEQVSESIASAGRTTGTVNRSYNKKSAPYLDKTVQNKSNLKAESTSSDAGNGFAGGAPSSSGWQKASNNIGQSNVSSLQSFQGSRILNYSCNNYNTMGNELNCTNPVNGEEIWKITLDGDELKAGGFMGTPPLAVGGYIVIATFNGDINVYDSKSGRLVDNYKTNNPIRYQPVVEDGWIYATTTNGKLFAINTGNSKLTGWSTWGANASRTNISE